MLRLFFRLLWMLIKFAILIAFWPLFAIWLFMKGLFFIALLVIGGWLFMGIFGVFSGRHRRFW